MCVDDSLAKAVEDLAGALAADDCPKELRGDIALIKEKVEGIRLAIRMKYRKSYKLQKLDL